MTYNIDEWFKCRLDMEHVLHDAQVKMFWSICNQRVRLCWLENPLWPAADQTVVFVCLSVCVFVYSNHMQSGMPVGPI